jgi:L-fuculose-phosphate aldolase
MLTAIGDVMRRCYEKGWITTRDGNISLRKAKSFNFYITPSGVRKTIIHPESIIKGKIILDQNGKRVYSFPAGVKPSGEIEMHFLLQRDNFEYTRSVLHVHPTHVIACMYRGFDLQKICKDFPEIYRYTKVGPSVPILPATSQVLADATVKALGLKSNGSLEFDIVGQANHGVCAVARDPWSAYEHVERLNHICEIVLASGVSP